MNCLLMSIQVFFELKPLRAVFNATLEWTDIGTGRGSVNRLAFINATRIASMPLRKWEKWKWKWLVPTRARYKSGGCSEFDRIWDPRGKSCSWLWKKLLSSAKAEGVEKVWFVEKWVGKFPSCDGAWLDSWITGVLSGAEFAYLRSRQRGSTYWSRFCCSEYSLLSLEISCVRPHLKAFLLATTRY